MAIDPASYRDPTGQVHRLKDRIFRTVRPAGLEEYTFVRDSGALIPLIEAGAVISGEEVEPDLLGEDAPAGGLVIEHPRIPFISYPYEWAFGALKSAALLHLDIQITLLDKNIALSDASAYNVQFRGPNPVFIDFLSFRKYRDREHWAGHRQFCQQFLNPLLLTSLFATPFHDWYRGRLEGIAAEDLARILKWRHRLSWRILSHVVWPSHLQSTGGERTYSASVKAKQRGLARSSYGAMLIQLQNWISGLATSANEKTLWSDYAVDNTYDELEAGAKREFVGQFISATRPALVMDIGCNTGDHAKIALSSGARAVVGLDADHGALEQAFIRARAEDLNFLPLYQDTANPSPGQGWNNEERQSLLQRSADVDVVMALAFQHHLAIGRNIPLPETVRWITELAPRGVIEFVPKADPTVQKMLALRDDIFPDYSCENFMEILTQRARIVRQQEISSSGRQLFWFERDG
jgi:ribosomal protein L11 methylase PrmA